MQENKQAREIVVGHARLGARQLLERMKTTTDRSARQQLARRAFQLAQIAAMEEVSLGPVPNAVGVAGRSAWQVSANL